MNQIETQNAVPASVVKQNDRASLVTQLTGVQADLERAIRNLRQLEENYEEVFQDLRDKHPSFEGDLNLLDSVLDEITRINAQSKEEDLIRLVDDYNFLARNLDTALKSYGLKEEEANGRRLFDLIDESNYSTLESQLSEEEKAEIKAYAKQLWNELFPDSNVERFVKWAGEKRTGVPRDQLELTETQRILIAPAVGMESVVMGVVDLFDAQTYQDLKQSVETSYHMSYEDWCDNFRLLRYAYENLDSTELVAPAVSLVVGCMTVFGALSKVKTLNMPTNLEKIVTESLVASRGARVAKNAKILPAGVIGGLGLKYIE